MNKDLIEETKKFIKAVIFFEKYKINKLNKSSKYLNEKVAGFQLQDIETRQIMFSDYQISCDCKAILVQEKLKSESFIKSPFFYKVDMGDKKKDIYISKIKSQLENRICLWTSDVAKKRFLDIGEGGVLNKIEYVIEEGRLIEVVESRGFKKNDGFVKINDPVKKENEVCFVEKKIIKKRYDNKYVLGEIISLMKKEQDEAMRLPKKGVTVIEGVAGSGKSNIGFHRIAYLANEFPEEYSEKNMAVFCFNISLKKYLEKSLKKELDLENIKIFSIDNWGVKMVENLGYLSGKYNIKKIVDRKLEGAITEKILEDFLKSCYEEFKNNIKAENGSYQKLDWLEDADFMSKYEILKYLEGLKKSIKNRYISSRYYKESLEKKYELSLFEKRKSFIIKEYDKSFCFIMKERVLKGKWEEWYVFKNKIDAKKLLEKFYQKQFNTKGDIKNFSKLDFYIFLYLSIRIKRIFRCNPYYFKKFDHVLVDEFQDLKKMQLLVLNLIHKDSITLVGDLNQKIYGFGGESMLKEIFKIKNENIYKLKISHRSSLENLKFANEIVGNIGNDVYAIATGIKPIISIFCDNKKIKLLIDQIKNIRQKDKNSSICVIVDWRNVDEWLDGLKIEGIECYKAEKKSWKFSSDIAVTSFFQVKGLEFDYVIVFDIEELMTNKIGDPKNILFMIVTRARIQLYINCRNNLPDIIKKIDKSLYIENSKFK